MPSSTQLQPQLHSEPAGCSAFRRSSAGWSAAARTTTWCLPRHGTWTGGGIGGRRGLLVRDPYDGGQRASDDDPVRVDGG
ncbi:hypothetical protein [Nonomuraea rosea]|uniref:hypothetical protein n=1 Tax=Nonomuraea rosea TaxID=638574 RepID=UPI0031EE8D3D